MLGMGAAARVARECEDAAQARSSKLPRTLPASDHLILRKTYEEKHHKLRNEKCPGDSLVELRLTMLEEGEQKAEPLTKVTSKENAVENNIAADITHGGSDHGHQEGKGHQDARDA